MQNRVFEPMAHPLIQFKDIFKRFGFRAADWQIHLIGYALRVLPPLFHLSLVFSRFYSLHKRRLNHVYHVFSASDVPIL